MFSLALFFFIMISIFPIVCSSLISIFFFFSKVFFNISSWSYILCFFIDLCIIFVVLMRPVQHLDVGFLLEESLNYFYFWCYLYFEWLTQEDKIVYLIHLVFLYYDYLYICCLHFREVQFEHVIEGYNNGGFINFNLGFFNSLDSESIWLILTIFNGIGFIILQLVEFSGCSMEVLTKA